MIGIDPAATNIAAAKLHADKSQLSIDYRNTTVEQMDPRERFDIVLGQAACTNSSYFSQFGINGSYSPIADYATLRRAVDECEKRGLNYKVGNLLSSDMFYSEKGIDGTMEWAKLGVLAVEMEAAALYMNAARAGKKALAICTISDLLIGGALTTSEERQTAFHDMMQVALTIAE